MNENENNYIKIIADALMFVKKYFIILIAFLIAGAAIGIYKSFNSTTKYYKYIIYTAGIIENKIAADMVNSLKDYMDYNDNAQLAKKIKINEEATTSITGLNAEVYKDGYSRGFVVRVEMDNNKYADNISKALLDYINENQYYQENYKMYVNQRQNILDVIDSILTNSMDVTSENFVILFDKKIIYEQDIELYSKAKIVDEYLYKASNKYALVKSVLSYSIGFIVLGLIISVIIESFKKVLNFLKKNY